MEGTITYSQLAMLIVFLLVLGAGVYGIIVLKKISSLLTHTNAALKSNLENMNRIIPNIALISDNALEITSEMKTGAAEVRETLGALSIDVAEAVTVFNEAADRVGDYSGLIEGAAKMLFEKLGNVRKSA